MNKTWKENAGFGLTLWVFLSVAFVIGNEMSNDSGRVSIFPTLLSPLLLLSILYQFLRRRVQEGLPTVKALYSEAIHVVGLAAFLSIPVVWGYAHFYFNHPGSDLALVSGLMSFVWITFLGSMGSLLMAWVILKFNLAEYKEHTQ